jgi:hypothetical protein
MTALMILAGILMLLPGLCSIFGGVVIATGHRGGARDPLVIALGAVPSRPRLPGSCCFAARHAVRRPIGGNKAWTSLIRAALPS